MSHAPFEVSIAIQFGESYKIGRKHYVTIQPLSLFFDSAKDAIETMNRLHLNCDRLSGLDIYGLLLIEHAAKEMAQNG